MIDSTDHGHEIKPGSDRSFGLVFGILFAILGAYAALGSAVSSWIWFALAAATIAIALIAPAWLAPLNRLWFRFGMLLARVIQPLVVGVIFFFVVTPIGLMMRISGKDILRLKYDPTAETYWIKRDPPGPPPETMTRQF